MAIDRAQSNGSYILSVITGSVLLIHILGLVALMVQNPCREVPERPAKMAVHICDQPAPRITDCVEPRGPSTSSLDVSTTEPAQVFAPHDRAPAASEVAQGPPTEVALMPPKLDPAPVIPSSPQPSIAVTKSPAVRQLAKPASPQRTAAKPDRPVARRSATKSASGATMASRPPDKLKSSAAAQAALKRLRQANALDATPSQTTTLPGLQSAELGRRQNESHFSKERALEALMAALQNCVVIPEQGEVRMRIQINAQGRITKMQCLKAASSRNREAIEKALRLIRLPVDGLLHDGSVSVVVTFKHA